jgi:hypothetical protein
VVVPFTEWAVTNRAMHSAVELGSKLIATVTLVAVYAIPYPAPFHCPMVVRDHLVGQLTDLAGRCPLPVSAHLVLARSRDEGFRHFLKPESTIVLGARNHWWTMERRLARKLTRDGHKVAVIPLG